MTSDGEGIE